MQGAVFSANCSLGVRLLRQQSEFCLVFALKLAMLLIWDQTSFTGVTPSCHLDIQVSLGLVKQTGEELPQNLILEQAMVVCTSAHNHSHISGTTATTRGQLLLSSQRRNSQYFYLSQRNGNQRPCSVNKVLQGVFAQANEAWL